MSDWNTQVINEFRANKGKVGQFGDSPLVILHTIGAKSGEERLAPLVALVQGEAMYVFASKGGAPTHPDWYFNLVAHPEIEVEYGDEIFRAKLTELSAEESAKKIADQAALMPQFGEYVTSAAPRLIPAFSIERV